MIRIDPGEIATIERRYVLDYIEGADASFLTQVLSRRVTGE